VGRVYPSAGWGTRRRSAPAIAATYGRNRMPCRNV
jgi:hypothetical protein